MPTFVRGDTYWIDFRFAGKRYRRPVASITDGGGKKKAKSAAEDALVSIKGRIAAGTFDPADLAQTAPAPEPPPDPGVLFDRALDLYLEARFAQGKSVTSYKRLRGASRGGKPGKPGDWERAFTGRPLRSITSDEIEEHLSRWGEKRKLSPASRNRALAQLSAFLSYCYGRRWIDAHPTERGRVPKLREDNARTRWLRLHEVETLIAACATRAEAREEGSAAYAVPDARGRAWLRDTLPALLRFGVMTGMRLGEVCSLRRASYQDDGEGRAFLFTDRTKNGTRLAWPLETGALEIVKAQLGTIGPFPGAHLFPGPKGGRAESVIRRELRGVVEAAGLAYGRYVERIDPKTGERSTVRGSDGCPVRNPEGVTFHTLRHSMASLSLNAGIPEHVVQQMGNWKTATMTRRYAHLADEGLRTAAGTLATLVRGHAVVTPSEASAAAPKSEAAVTA